MAPSLLESVRDAYAMYEKGEIDACIDKYCTEDISWCLHGDTGSIPWFAGEVRGHDAVKAHFRKMVEVVEPTEFAVKKIIVQDAAQAQRTGASSSLDAVVSTHNGFRCKKTGVQADYDAAEVGSWVEADGRWLMKKLVCFGDTAPLEKAAAAAKAGGGSKSLTEDVAATLDRAYSVYESGDKEFLLDMLTDDVVFEFTGDASKFPPKFAGTLKGKQQVKEHWEVQGSLLRFTELQRHVMVIGNPGEAPGGGTWAAVTGYCTATAVKSGKSARNHWSHLFNVHNGKMSSFYMTTDFGQFEKLLDM